jgi:hypothetical protein
MKSMEEWTKILVFVYSVEIYFINVRICLPETSDIPEIYPGDMFFSNVNKVIIENLNVIQK